MRVVSSVNLSSLTLSGCDTSVRHTQLRPGTMLPTNSYLAQDPMEHEVDVVLTASSPDLLAL